MSKKDCAHPKDSRALLAGYDVYCANCESIIGRVALFPAAVLSADEAWATMKHLREGGSVLVREAREKLAYPASLSRRDKK